MPETPVPYERQPGESAKAYAAFTAFRDLGPGRSVLKAYRQETGKEPARQPSGTWIGWAARWHWHDRAEAWDAELDRQNRAAQEEARRQMGERHAKEAMGLQKKALERLEQLCPAELSAGDVLRYFVEAAKLERLARGAPETITERRHEITGPHGADLFARIEQYAATIRPLLGPGLAGRSLPGDGRGEPVHPAPADPQAEAGPAP
jgi:hypothetical protein